MLLQLPLPLLKNSYLKGLGCEAQGSGLVGGIIVEGVQGVGSFRVKSLRLRVQDLGFRVEGSEFEVQGWDRALRVYLLVLLGTATDHVVHECPGL